VGYLEGRFKVAEKIGRNKRAAAAAALEPWLNPEVPLAVKEATVKALIAADVAPSKRQQRQQQHLAPPPVKPARWSGCLPQQLQLGVEGACWGNVARQQQQQQQLGVRGEVGVQGPAPKSSTTARAASSSEAADTELQSERQQRVVPAHGDMDALLAALLADDEASAAAPNSSKAAAGKKKKETAAQKEAKKQQKLRLQRLQEQQQQQGDSSSDSEAEGQTAAAADADAGIDKDAVLDAEVRVAEQETSTVAGARIQAGAGEVTGAQPGAVAREQRKQQQTLRQPKKPMQDPQPELAQGELQDKVPAKQQKGKQGKASAQQKQQQQQQKQQQQDGNSSSAAALLQTQGRPTRQAAAGVTPARGAAAGSALNNGGVQSAPPAPLLPPGAAAGAGAPAACASNASTGCTSPQHRPFLPPHLRMSMPAATTGDVAVQQTGQGAPAAAQQAATQPQPVQQPRDAQQRHQQQQQDQKQEMPGLPRAMMVALAGAVKHTNSAAAAAPGKSAGRRGARTAAAGPGAGSKTAGAGAAGTATPAVGGRHSVRPAGSSKNSADGSRNAKLCLSCGQQRRNVLLLPCKHIVLCDACAGVDSCPSCGKPCTQRIRVHQS
jgi:hypothetical protein